ncbi:MAG: nucleotide pyrophosphohydrolase [Pseudohongiellaceae bacterium]
MKKSDTGTCAPATIAGLQQQLREFAHARDWEQFHTPKNLAMALTVEAGELQEIFQWLTETQSKALEPAQREHAAQELADVLLYLCRLADVLDIDLLQAASAKLQLNAERYPVDKARGLARKYSDL